MGEKEKARDSLTQALELSRAAGDPVGEAAILREMGNMAAASGDWRQAINLLQQSLSLARATGDLQGERDALVNLAQTERERNNLSEARDYHEKALELTESTPRQNPSPGITRQLSGLAARANTSCTRTC